MSILHTSTIDRLPKIIKDGYLLPKYPDDKNISAKGVYGVYVFKDMNYDGKYWYYGSDVQIKSHIIFVINPAAFTHLKFIICSGIRYGSCIHYPEDIIMSNIKNLNPIKSKKSKPADFVKTTIKYPAFNKQKLETFINTQLTANITSKPKTYDVLTHEVVFLEPIPLKYIDKIIVAPSMVKRVTEFILKIKEKGIINSDLQLQILRRPDATQWKSALFKE